MRPGHRLAARPFVDAQDLAPGHLVLYSTPAEANLVFREVLIPAGVEMMRRQKQPVEQIVMVTDEEEKEGPHFVETLKRYSQELNVSPHIVFVKTRGASGQLETECKRERIPFDTYQFQGDYYALPNLVPLLARPSRLDLLLDIMAYPLPRRKTA